MTWFRVDDGLLDNPKIEELHERLADAEGTLHAAMHMWLVAGVYSSRNLTDGRVREAKLRALTGSSQKVFVAALEALVSVGLLVQANGAVSMHDWSDWNPTREEVEVRRSKDARRKRSTGIPNGVRAESERSPDGDDSESTRNPRLPDPDPDPDPLPIRERESARARTPVGGNPESEPDERRRAILETLALHPGVWLPGQHANIADSVMAGQLAAPKPVDHIRRSIHEAASKIMATEAGGEHFPPARRATFLVGCVASLAKQTSARNGGATDPKSREAAEAERLAANEAARAAKAAQERKARPAEPTAEERRVNAANAKAARLALARVGSGPVPAVSTAPTLPPIRGSDEVEDAAVERGRADRARLDAWAATAEVQS